MFSKSVTYLLVLLFTAQAVIAQRNPVDTAHATGKLLEIMHAGTLTLKTVDSAHKYTIVVGNAILKQDKTLFYADSVIWNEVDNSMEAFGNVHINDADSVNVYSQYLKYLSKEKKAYLNKKVKLTDGKGVLTTEELEYDVTVKIGTYTKNGKLVNKKTVLTSKEGYYYGDTKDVIFKQKVVLIDPEYKIYSDTLQYNTNTEITTFTSPTTLYDTSGRIIKTREGFFDRKNKKGMLFKRSVIDDSSYTFTADEMAFDDSTKLSEFRGNAVYRGKDTAQGFDMIANNIKRNGKKDIILATEKPILLIKQGMDSIFVTADTLYSARLSDLIKTRPVPVVRNKDTSKIRPDSDTAYNKPDTTSKYFEAYYHVKIYSDSLQAKGDSLFYSLKDSVFRLFTNPIVWAQENQITGDTIYLYVKNKKPERLYVFESAMAISRVDSTQYFNQVKGTTINAYFNEGKINFLRAKGGAENVYYGQDEQKKFIGVNKSTADLIDVVFDAGKPKRVTFQRNLDGTMYPMHQVNHEEIRLRGYKWLDAVRPKSKYEILSN